MWTRFRLGSEVYDWKVSYMNNDIFNHIINRLLSNANDTLKDAQANDKDKFYVGKKLAYYEVLDTIKNDLIIAEYDLQECGLDIDLDNDYL